MNNLKNILINVNNIAIVGASSNPEKDSFKVMKFLIDYGYEIFPVNPNEINILGRKCYSSLKKIEENTRNPYSKQCFRGLGVV